MDDYETLSHTKWECKYHVVFCPKYRKPVLNPPIDAKLKKLIRQVCDETQSALIGMEVVSDHVHLLVGCDPLQCGTAPEDGDVECTSTCKREGLCPTPRP